MARLRLGLAQLVWVVVSAQAACNSQGEGPNTLDGEQYLLESSQGFEPLPDSRVSLSFRDGVLGFGAGCNGYGGPYALRDGVLLVSSFESTNKDCELPEEQQDHWLAAFFSSSPSVVQATDRLTLSHGGATLVFLDRELADPDRPLVGTAWSIRDLIRGDLASSRVYADTRGPMLTLAADGSYDFVTLCNSGKGRYSVRDDKLVFTDVTVTEAECAAPLDAEEDRHLYAVLTEGVVTYEIDARTLTLRRGALGLRASAP